MTAVPRLRDSVDIQRVAPDQYEFRPSDGGVPVCLSASGYDLLTRMDGVSEADDVRGAFEEKWGTPLSHNELEDWIEELDRWDCFVRESDAIDALSYLHREGIRVRGARVDRRDPTRTGGRREAATPRARWFDHAVFLLNDGLLSQSQAIFSRIAEEDPQDLRVGEISMHLDALLREDLPAGRERRDISWNLFDQVLRDFLRAGVCPACKEPVALEPGDLNRCLECGASYTSFVLDQCGEERRQS